MLSQKGFGTLPFLIIIFLISLSIVGGSFYLKNKSTFNTKVTTLNQTASPTSSDVADNSVVKNFKVIFQDGEDRQFYQSNVDGTNV